MRCRPEVSQGCVRFTTGASVVTYRLGPSGRVVKASQVDFAPDCSPSGMELRKFEHQAAAILHRQRRENEARPKRRDRATQTKPGTHAWRNGTATARLF